MNAGKRLRGKVIMKKIEYEIWDVLTSPEMYGRRLDVERLDHRLIEAVENPTNDVTHPICHNVHSALKDKMP